MLHCPFMFVTGQCCFILLRAIVDKPGREIAFKIKCQRYAPPGYYIFVFATILSAPCA